MATSVGLRFPVCLVAVEKHSKQESKSRHGDNDPELRPTSKSRKTGSLDEFTSHTGSSGIILDPRNGLVITSALPFIELMHCDQEGRNDHQEPCELSLSESEEEAEEKGYIVGEALSDLSVSVIAQRPKYNINNFVTSNCSELLNSSSHILPPKDAINSERYCQTNVPDRLTLRRQRQLGKQPEMVADEAPPESMLVHDARVLLLWRCHTLASEISRLVPHSEGWQLDYGEKDGETGDRSFLSQNDDEVQLDTVREKTLRGGNTHHKYLSWFALLKVDGMLAQTSHVSIFPRPELRVGQPVVACGTPFATLCPSIFLNSLSAGIVAKTTGGKGALIMTDARCMPGTEGGGVFICDKGQKSLALAAVIVSPLCWKSNEWIGLTLACSMEAILNSLQSVAFGCPSLGSMNFADFLRSTAPRKFLSREERKGVSAFDSVVLLRVGPVWGSGVIVNAAQGLIVTCRHVVKRAPSSKVRVKVPSHPWVKGDILFVTSDLSPLDLAIVKITDDTGCGSLVEAELSSDCAEGNRVYAVGYPLFDPSQSTDYAVTSGVVSKVVRVDHTPVMIQSSCAVHPGASGGALLCAHTGRLVGIIASNSKDAESGATFPHVNFSIPVSCFRSPLEKYIRTKDLQSFHELNTSEDSLCRVWSLQEGGRYQRITQSKL
ncbi:peroxisomal leader peptide-processing protease-like [Diadema antillarum]|uniref:peroxisomal leader peptide-processing protease-like n=1 Tax=Diadema antillarum TaxID=105358 RepID=UPI003A86C62F